jgi:predicted DNA-binding ribbon-helix-helix protein
LSNLSCFLILRELTLYTTLVYSGAKGALEMAKDTKSQKSTRTSVSINTADYRELERLAELKKVTVAWIIRDAVEKYLSSNSPLFARSEVSK